MENRFNLTKGPIASSLFQFALPYLITIFLQQLYGLADLFIAGQFDGTQVSAAISIGSQFMHMVTVVIIGLSMGTTVMVSRWMGAQDFKKASRSAGNTLTLFLGVSIALSIILLMSSDLIVTFLHIPADSIDECLKYLRICLAGIPVITAYNLVSCICRGCGDSVSPTIFVLAACILNIGLDVVFVGPMNMDASGAAWGTLLAQFFSVIIALTFLKRHPLPIQLRKEDFKPDPETMKSLLSIGVPIACQDGFIQVAFLIITMIGNMRGLTDAAAIGIVEKIISFLFMVPSALSQSLSAFAAQNIGAAKYGRAMQSLKISCITAVGYGALVVLLAWIAGAWMISLFIKDSQVVEAGAAYFRSYSFDTLGVGIHFCMASYFCAYQKSMISFIQNALSVILFRIPLAWLASIYFPQSLFWMGLAAPIGSLFQAVFCLVYFRRHLSLWNPKIIKTSTKRLS
ncbi:MATE family efflux transporter [Ileibacterium valens]|uniref:MATE family efflux transporter n=1 Tax=Ileibacterium valens TaxID=1862668 RepID=UPI00272D6DBA|nr:MATE family efflux transporter [Ileibacterium valens]